MNNTFPKQDKLCGRLLIETLYRQGQKMVVWPLRVTYLKVDEPTRVLIWAPKSLHKHAVDRNRLRRQMREAWRLNSADYKQGWHLSFYYMDREMQPYDHIEHAMKKALRKLGELTE